MEAGYLSTEGVAQMLVTMSPDVELGHRLSLPTYVDHGGILTQNAKI